MTVTYTDFIHTAGRCGIFRLLGIWQGSLLKAIWPDVIIYFAIYYVISLLYRFVFSSLDEEYKRGFEHVCVYCQRWSKLIPLSFLLGFYVSLVVSRWWSQFTALSWPDTLAMYLATYLPGGGRSKEIRRAVVRWACLSNVLTLMTVSPKVSMRFPSYEYLVKAQLLTESEMIRLKKLRDTTEGHHAIVFHPIQWAQIAIRKAFSEGLLHMRHELELIRECDKISGCNGWLLVYGWIPIPLAYTQVVTIAVYTYFLAGLFGNQFLSPTLYVQEGFFLQRLNESESTAETRFNAVNLVGYDDNIVDFYVPFFSVLEFIFYNGWLKVAGALLSPFGTDDDDFDVNYLIDRNMLISFIMVEQDDVDIEPDPFGDGILPPLQLPHTATSVRDGPFRESRQLGKNKVGINSANGQAGGNGYVGQIFRRGLSTQSSTDAEDGGAKLAQRTDSLPG